MTQLSRRTILKAGMAGFAASAFPGIAFAKAKKEDKKAAKSAAAYDAIVLGAGAAGLIAAITAVDSGAKRVAILEQMDRPNGNAIYALGNICGWGSKRQIRQGIKDTAEDFYKAMMVTSNWRADPALTRTYTNDIPSGLDWLDHLLHQERPEHQGRVRTEPSGVLPPRGCADHRRNPAVRTA